MINNRLGTLLLGGIFVVGAVTFNTLTNNSRPADIKDALNDDDIWTRPSNSEERMIMPEPKPTADYAGGNKQKESGALNLSKGIDADGQEYRHVPNSGNYQGVYMTQSKNATGFLDIFGAGKGFCQGDKLSVSIRAVNKQGKPVVMGRTTYRSIGKPLPDRLNIVLSNDMDLKISGCVVVHSVEEALGAARDVPEVMIIGGASIYRQFLPLARRMYLTRVRHNAEGDIYFPEFNKNEWQEISRADFKADDKNPYDYSFLTFERK